MTETMPREVQRTASAPYIKVWDIPTRVFHWVIVFLVALSWFSADRGHMKLHLWSGLLLLTLLLFRIAWGVIGSTTARFSDFVAGPGTVIGYLRTLVKGNKPVHAGHNPAGGWMAITLILMLCAQAATGLFASDGLHFSGPLSLKVSQDTSDRITELHGTLFNFILLFVWMHIVAVFFYLFVKGENLIGPMISGRKHHSHVPHGIQLRFVRLSIACALLVCFAAVVGWFLIRGA